MKEQLLKVFDSNDYNVIKQLVISIENQIPKEVHHEDCYGVGNFTW